VKKYLKSCQEAEYIRYATGSSKAIILLEAADEAHNQQIEVMNKMKHIANVFECIQDMDTPIAVIEEVEALLKDYRNLWNTAIQILGEINGAKNMLWSTLDSDLLEDTAKVSIRCI